MTKLTISNSLLAAVKNAAVSMGDTFVLSVLPKEVGAGCRQASLSCCNGNAMSNIYLPVKADDDACGEYIFGKEFGQIVQTLSAYDEKDFVIKRKEEWYLYDYMWQCGCSAPGTRVCREDSSKISD